MSALNSFIRWTFSLCCDSIKGNQRQDQTTMECNTNLTLGPGGEARRREVIKKKLCLSKEQSSLLENTFREHNTLTSVEKQELAECLNLRPRQVEVWFQNRRARTKQKKTEMDCELWKRYCETLADENRQLKKENQELKSRKAPCLLCQRIGTERLSTSAQRFMDSSSKALR